MRESVGQLLTPYKIRCMLCLLVLFYFRIQFLCLPCKSETSSLVVKTSIAETKTSSLETKMSSFNTKTNTGK